MRKFFTLIVTLFIVSILAFLAFQVIPGDAAVARLGVDATPESIQALRGEMGLDRPLPVRYADWLGRFLFGDMGQSYVHDRSVAELLGNRLIITGSLMGLSFLLTAAVALPVGLFTANRQRGPTHWIVTAVSQVVMAVPPLFLGLVLTFLFAVVFRLFAPGAFISYHDTLLGYLGYMLFPALAIALPKSAMTIRLIRSSVRSELGKDYVQTAVSRGRGSSAILYRHILPNIAVPVITFLALTLTMMITDAIVVEQVFSIPGLGRLLISAIENRDYPVVQAVVVIIAAFVMAVYFLSDLLCRAIDRRIVL